MYKYINVENIFKSDKPIVGYDHIFQTGVPRHWIFPSIFFLLKLLLYENTVNVVLYHLHAVLFLRFTILNHAFLDT